MLTKNKEVSAEKMATLIGEDTVVEGSLQAKGTVKIDGKYEGEMNSEGDIVVGESGKIEGNIRGRNILISGAVRGEVCAQGKVEISSSGKLEGDIKAEKLIIDEGAVFDGNCSMQADRQEASTEVETG